MKLKLILKVSATVALAAFFLVFCEITQASAEGDSYTVKTGYLTCQEAGGWGFIIGSSRDIHCEYAPSNSGRTEYYSGSISKFGADIGYLKSAVVVWAVAATTNDLKPGALEGSYGGAAGSLTLGAGAGANFLVGGFHRSFALQPVSFEGQRGLNVAAGIAALSLHFEGLNRPH